MRSIGRSFLLCILMLVLSLTGVDDGVAHAIGINPITPPTQVLRQDGWSTLTQQDFQDGVLTGTEASSYGDVRLLAQWYDTAWSRRVPVIIDNAGGGALTGYR